MGTAGGRLFLEKNISGGVVAKNGVAQLKNN